MKLYYRTHYIAPDMWEKMREIASIAMDQRIDFISAKRFIVLGLGGVGSAVAYLLSWSTKGSVITLIDTDNVEKRNIGRGLFYDFDTLDQKKFDVLLDYLSPFNFYTDHIERHTYIYAIDCTDRIAKEIVNKEVDYAYYLKVGVDRNRVNILLARDYNEIEGNIWGSLDREDYSAIFPEVFFRAASEVVNIIRTIETWNSENRLDVSIAVNKEKYAKLLRI